MAAVQFQHRLLILDEPTTASSLEVTAKVLGCVDGARRQGISVIPHDSSHARRVSQKFAVLHHGGVAGTVRRDGVDPVDLANLVSTGRRNSGEGAEDATDSRGARTEDVP